MTKFEIAWFAIGLYVLVTVILTVRGALRTKGFQSFALGNRDIHPAFVGLSLTAQLTSVATFVVNPGLIYAYGLSGLLGFGVSASFGLMLGLSFFSSRFRRVGSQVAALSIPQWIGLRYQSPFLRIFFALLSLALLSFVVLIVISIAYVLSPLLGLSPKTLVLATVIFVFGYIMIGGANTHTYTNAIQALIMLLVALILIQSGFHLFSKEGGFLASLAKIQPELASITNPKSLFFRNLFEVFVCNFLVGIAIVCQPHIVSKALYLKEDRQVRVYLAVALSVGVIFMLVMLVGLYARLSLPVPIAKIDLVVPTYIATTFSDPTQVLIAIGLLAAGISTLEGILLALSTIISSDLFLPFVTSDRSNPEASAKIDRQALLVGRLGLVIVGLFAVFLSFWQIDHPTSGSVAIFGQYGVYLLFTTSFFPLVCGMFFPSVSSRTVALASLAAFLTYLLVAYFRLSFMSNNPAFLATCALFVGSLIVASSFLRPKPQTAASDAPSPKKATFAELWAVRTLRDLCSLKPRRGLASGKMAKSNKP